MAASEIEICNRALSRIGQTDQLEDLAPTLEEVEALLTGVAAEQCVLHYAASRDFVLRGPFSWPFATVREALAVVAGEARSDWAYVYAYPAGALKVRFVALQGVRNPRPDQIPSHKIETRKDAAGAVIGKLILCDQVDAEISYTARVTNPAAFDADFEAALVALLASRLAPALVKGAEGSKLAKECLDEHVYFVRLAAANAANEQKDDPEPPGAFLASRG